MTARPATRLRRQRRRPALASILQGAGRATERQVLEGLEAVDPELAEAVRAKMFTFEDMVKLSDKDLQLVLRDIDGKDLVLALRAACPRNSWAACWRTCPPAPPSSSRKTSRCSRRRRSAPSSKRPRPRSSPAIRTLDEAGQITLPMSEEAGEDGGDTEVML